MRWTVLVTCWVLVFGTVRQSAARDVIFTIGGGADPTSNQISLEKNVQFFQRTVAQRRTDDPRHEIFFADGKSALPDLQFRDEQAQISDSAMWLSTLASNEQAADLKYRDHQIEPVSGPARKAFLKQSLIELSQTMAAGDRLIIYVTAHGGPAVPDYHSTYGAEYGIYGESEVVNENDTTIALWNEETLSMTELTEWLGGFDPQVEIVMVMAQCYSGGFAHAIFHNGNRRLGLSGRPRCGFFSQRHDRPSAGCTPDVLESEYQDYSTFFWAALGGNDRLGQAVEEADYNEDGKVDFSEAHAYALVTSRSLDIPLKTSGVLLRRYAKLGSPVDDATEQEPPGLSGAVASFFGGDNRQPQVPTLVYDAADLLTRQSTIEGALELSSSDQRVVIERLTEELELPHQTTVQAVRSRFRRAGTKLETRREAYAVKAAEYEVLRSQLSGVVKQQYPEMAVDGYTPIFTDLTTTRSDEFLTFLAQQTQVDAMLAVADEMTEAADKVSEQENREARIGRLLATLEEVLLEENLPQTAPQEIIDQYGRMLNMEHGTL